MVERRRRQARRKRRATRPEINATLVRVRANQRGRRATAMLGPDLTAEQRKAVEAFGLARWMPILLSSMTGRTSDPSAEPAA